MELEEAYINSLGITVADHVSAMLAYWDKDLVCRFANTAYLEWFGKRKEDMIDQITLEELLGPLFEKNFPYITAVLNGETQTFEREIQLPDGSTRHSLANYYPDVINGEVKGFFVHVADVTPIKVLEKDLVQSNEIIREQNKRLLNFANIVSHNLKSYANNLKAILEMFAAARSESEKSEMLNYLHSISGGFSLIVEHLNKIVEVQNQGTMNFEQISLHEHIEKCIDILQVQVKSSRAVIENEVDQNVMLWGNPVYMESILLNFLTNAIKYSYPGRPPLVRFSSFFENNRIVLVIEDNGRGIDLAKHGKDLFGMYKTFHDNPDAQGIGLFITKYQVEAMNGRIKVESEEGKGTIFSISFSSVK